MLSLICPELGVTPPVDPGTDVEDELSIPASPLADVSHAVVSLSVQADVDNELERVFVDVGSLPTMVTPVSDPDGALRMTPAGCPAGVAPGVSTCVIQPSMASSPAGPDVRSLGFSHPSTGSVGDLLVNRSSPIVSAPGEFLLPQAADLNLTQPEAGPTFTGDLAGGLFPAVPLTPVRPPAAASRHSGESDAVGGPSGAPDLSREGLIHLDNPRSASSPQLLQDNQGCPFRMTSYDEGTDGPNFAPENGVQLHDPRLLEYVGAPESARLTSRSPDYWIHHMGREKALSAALQLQHDAGLIISNVQVLQQLVTALNRTSSDVLRAVHGRQPFPVEVIQQVMPSYRVRRAAHYMMAMGLWRPPVAAEIRALLPGTSCNACRPCTSCRVCCPDVPM